MAGMKPACDPHQNVARFGAVSFLNTRPLIDGLDHDPRVQLRYAVPSALAGLLMEGLVDAALVPVVDLARSAGRWQRVSNACIASDGRTLTVRVYSKVPPEQMEVLHIDADSHTSVALARIIWSNVFHRPLRIEPVPPVDKLRDCESVLLIGDKVATTPMPWFDHHVDLGDAWKKWTGFPFVFAVWAASSDLDAETGKNQGELRRDQIARILETARDRGVARALELAVEFGPQRGWPVALAKEYFSRTLMYTLTPAALAGMNRFFDLLAEAGIAPRVGEPTV